MNVMMANQSALPFGVDDAALLKEARAEVRRARSERRLRTVAGILRTNVSAFAAIVVAGLERRAGGDWVYVEPN